jgi:hypothetical protein
MIRAAGPDDVLEAGLDEQGTLMKAQDLQIGSSIATDVSDSSENGPRLVEASRTLMISWIT